MAAALYLVSCAPGISGPKVSHASGLFFCGHIGVKTRATTLSLPRLWTIYKRTSVAFGSGGKLEGMKEDLSAELATINDQIPARRESDIAMRATRSTLKNEPRQ